MALPADFATMTAQELVDWLPPVLKEYDHVNGTMIIRYLCNDVSSGNYMGYVWWNNDNSGFAFAVSFFEGTFIENLRDLAEWVYTNGYKTVNVGTEDIVIPSPDSTKWKLGVTNAGESTWSAQA